MMGSDCTSTNYKRSFPVVCLLSSIVAGRLLHQLVSASGTQPKVGWTARAGPQLGIELPRAVTAGRDGGWSALDPIPVLVRAPVAMQQPGYRALHWFAAPAPMVPHPSGSTD